MRRRDFLGSLATTALACSVPLRIAVARATRAPRNLLARLHRRTRPLNDNSLYEPHDLAG